MLTYIVGAPRTGKTTLGRKLAAERGARLISTDDFLHLPHDRQLDAIRAMIEVASGSARNVIVEGVTAARLLPHRPDGRVHAGPVPDEVIWVRGPSEEETRYRGLTSWVTRFVESYAAKAPVRTERRDSPDAPSQVWTNRTRTRNMVRLFRAVGQARRLRKIPRQRPALAIEASLGSYVAGIIRGLKSELEPLLEALPGLLAEEAVGKRQDVGEIEAVTALMEKIRARMRARMQPENIRGTVQRAGEAASDFQKKQFERQVRAGLGVDVVASDAGVAGAVEGFVSESVALIRHLPEKAANDIERAVLEAFRTGETYTEVGKKVAALLGSSEEYGRHVASQQVAQLNASVTELRHRNIGVSQYVWRTANDEKVRPRHRAREGHAYSWNDPPGGETPGSAPGWFPCRCYAEPDFSGLIGDE